MAPVLTFSLFTIIAKVKNEQSLLIAQAFTSLTVLSLLGTPIVIFVQIIPMIVATIASFSRIQDFLASGSVTHQRLRQSELAPAQIIPSGTNESKDPDICMTKLKSDAVILSVENGTFGWKPEIPVLRNININVQKRKFVAIIGPVGSGKSTLLKALLEEIPFSEGIIHRNSTVAFSDQNPWITNTTLRANIIGPSEFDGPWYEAVLHACLLEDDLKALPGGDGCLLGSKGLALSGGQKNRVVGNSIPRAESGRFLTFLGTC